MPTRSGTRIGGLALSAVLAVVGAGATMPVAGEPSASGLTSTETDPRVRRMAADSLAQVAFTLIRSAAKPGVAQYRAAALILQMARQYEPADVDLLRSELEAWTAAGDLQNELRATRELVKLDPKDTVAQLRLLNAGIERAQDAEARLAMFERLLGPEGAKLDESIRSRLALDAALLARETGDERAFLDKLTYAVTADVTNKDAAALYASYFLERSTNPRERVDILANLILSDPLDPESHRNLAHELMSHGAFRSAERFFGMASRLSASAGREPNDAEVLDYAIAVWNAYGPARALQIMQAVEMRGAAEIRRQIAELEAKGKTVKEPPPTLIAAPLETLRLGIAVARGDEAEIQQTFLRTAMVHVETMKRYREVNPDPSPEVAAYLDQLERETGLNLMWLRLMSGLELDQAAEAMEAMKARGDLLSAEALARFEGWMAIRRGDTAKGRELLTPLADNDPVARYALGVAAEAEGNTALAVEEYRRLAERETMTVLGSVARMRVERLTNRPFEAAPEVRELDSAMLNFAPFLNEMVTEPRSFVSLRIEHVNSRVDALGRVELRVRLRNEMGASGIPLAVGPGRPLHSRILLSPDLSTSVVRQIEMTPPEVLKLDRRLRLKPGESIEAVFWGGRGNVGRLMDTALNFQCVLRWRAVQGFKVTPEGRYEAGPMCIGADSDIMTREAASIPATAGAMADEMATAQGDDLLRVVTYFGVALRQSDMHIANIQEFNATAPPERQVEIPPQLIQDRQVLIATLLQRMATMSSAERVVALIRTGIGGWLDGESLTQTLDVLRDETDPRVGVALLVSIREQPTEAVMAWVRDRNDPMLSELAETIRNLGSDGDAEPAADVEPSAAEAPAETGAAATTP